MFAEMNTMVDEVRQIEGRVIEISRLQEVFAEKILDQVRVIINDIDHKCCVGWYGVVQGMSLWTPLEKLILLLYNLVPFIKRR